MLTFEPIHSLDIAPSSIHSKRRIWQESITTLLLTRAECAIPKEQAMEFAQSRNSEFPPYLLGFRGTPGERHAENLKVWVIQPIVRNTLIFENRS